MAVFTPDSAGNLSNLTDLKKVQEYLYRMNEQLQYMFRNLTPEDNNASGTPSLSYATGQTVKIIVDGNELDVVLADEVIKAINASIESAKIAAGRISINGIASAGNRFQIDNEGRPSLADGTAQNMTISASALTNCNASGGTISNASISGGTIDGADIENATASNVAHQTGSIGPFDVDAYSISGTDMSILDTGEAEFSELTLADSFWQGETVTTIVKQLWDAVFPTTP